MDTVQQLASMLDLYQLSVTLILVLHALSVLPQWWRHYFNVRFLRVSMLGMMLGLAQGAVIVEVVEYSASPRGGGLAMLGAALLMHGWIAVQNLMASNAFVHLHRPSAVAAQRMLWATRPLGYLSAALTLVAWIYAS